MSPFVQHCQLGRLFLFPVEDVVCRVHPSCQRQTNTISKTKIVLDLNATRNKMFAKEIKRRDELMLRKIDKKTLLRRPRDREREAPL